MTLLGLKREIDFLKTNAKTLRPSTSPGALTNHTTRGTTRSVFALLTGANSTSSTSTAPRWQ